jgi:hypothetical protein
VGYCSPTTVTTTVDPQLALYLDRSGNPRKRTAVVVTTSGAAQVHHCVAPVQVSLNDAYIVAVVFSDTTGSAGDDDAVVID